MVRAAWMEKIMSKTNDTAATRVLTDNELDTVAGGELPNLNRAVIEILSVPPPPPPAWSVWPIW
jgi:hypothetical protein